MKTKKNLSPAQAAEAIMKEMVIRFGVGFMADFEDIEQEEHLYVVLCDFEDGINPSPIFRRVKMAETFVECCRKYIPGFKNKEVRICKLTAV